MRYLGEYRKHRAFLPFAELDDKDEVINDILVNSVYTPESGMYKQIAKSLLRLSNVSLHQLLLIIQNRPEKED